MRRGCIVAFAVMALAGTAQAECLKADKAEQSLEGRLTVGRFENYERKMVPAFILRLQKPACLTGDGEYDKVGDTRLVHVFSLEAPTLRQLRKHAGKRVRVTGAPFGQSRLYHHYAPIVMNVTQIDAR